MKENKQFKAHVIEMLKDIINSYNLSKIHRDYSNSRDVIKSTIILGLKRLNINQEVRDYYIKTKVCTEMNYQDQDDLFIKSLLFIAYCFNGENNSRLKEYKSSMEDFRDALNYYVEIPDEITEYLMLEIEIPNLSVATVGFGSGLYKIGEYDQGIEYFKAIYALDNSLVMALYYVASCYYEKKIFQEAIHYYTLGINHNFWARCLSTSYHLVKFYLGRGIVYNKIGSHELALDDFNSALNEKGSLPEIYFQRGLAYQKLSDFCKALSDFDKAISRSKNVFKYYFERGRINSLIQKYSEAILDFTRAINLNNKSDLSYFERAVCYLKAGDFQKSIEDFDKVISNNKKNFIAYYHVGVAYYKLHNKEKALEYFNRAIDVNPLYGKAIEFRDKIK